MVACGQSGDDVVPAGESAKDLLPVDPVLGDVGSGRRVSAWAVWVPRRSSTSCDQAIFVDHAAEASVPSDTVLLKINRFR